MTGDEAQQRGWSLRAVARAAGLSLGSVRNLMRADLGLLPPGPLGRTDVLCVRVLSELGANRSTNRSSQDARTAILLERDRTAVALLRDRLASGHLESGVRLLVQDRHCWLARRDAEVLAALDDSPGMPLQVIPVGRWAAELGLAARAAAA